MLKTKLIFSEKLPARTKFSKSSVLFYDSILSKKPFFNKWSQQFSYKVALKSGEKLKSIEEFKKVAEKISQMSVPQTQDLTFIAVGGGSVGDFVGFLASIYLRGRHFIQVPSTWLAAVDSAHGGKNGLNLGGKKNQLGTFYWPSKTYLVKELLASQPTERMTDALGEVIKISLIGSKKIFKAVADLNNMDLYKLLPLLIKLKLSIVNQDPYEKLGARRILNLGHTMGHVFESYFKWSHGTSVWAGIIFTLRYSYNKGFLSDSEYIEIWNTLHQVELNKDYQQALQSLSARQVKAALIKDKKMTNENYLDFVFIHAVEKIKRSTVSIEEVLREFKRQKREI